MNNTKLQCEQCRLYKYNDNIYLHEYWVYTVNKLPVNKSYLLSNFLTRSDHNKLGANKVHKVHELKWSSQSSGFTTMNKNSSADEIANVNFYAVRPEGTRIRWNKAI